MKNIEIGKQVIAHNGTASVGGMLIYEIFLTGKVIKVNAKSIRVEITNERRTQNGKETYFGERKGVISFKFWKTLHDGRDCYLANINCQRFFIEI